MDWNGDFRTRNHTAVHICVRLRPSMEDGFPRILEGAPLRPEESVVNLSCNKKLAHSASNTVSRKDGRA
jgi:hypothetical protein